MMNKKILFCMLALSIVVFLTSCGAGSPTENTLAAQIPSSALRFQLDDNTYDSTVSSLTIEKQKTDKTTDVAYCKVTCESDVLDRELFLCIYSSYSNKNGWTMDSYEQYHAPQLHPKAAPVTLEDGQQLIANQGYTIQEAIDHSELSSGFYNYEYVIHEDHKNLTVEGSASVTGSIAQDGFGEYYWVSDVSTSNVAMNWKVEGTWQLRRNSDDYTQIWNFQKNGDSYDMSFPDSPDVQLSIAEMTQHGKTLDDAELYIRAKVYAPKYASVSYHNLFIQPDSAYCIFWAGAQGTAERIAD